ncbi:hypothetical protein BH23BAC2_BH23BAC2_01430 [soil metagenome]
MMFEWIIILVLLILAVWYFGRGSFQWPRNQPGRESPLKVLKKRFARGEISKEEFEERKKVLFN